MLEHILKKNDEKKSSVFGAFKHVDQLHRAPPYTASSSSKYQKCTVKLLLLGTRDSTVASFDHYMMSFYSDCITSLHNIDYVFVMKQDF